MVPGFTQQILEHVADLFLTCFLRNNPKISPWKNGGLIPRYVHIMNYRFLTAETNFIFFCFFTTSSVKLFVVTVQIFVYKFLYTIEIFGKRKKTHQTFHILKMKTPFEKEPHFGNENTFQKRTTF